MPETLPNATPLEEIVDIRQELSPPAPHTAARFACWDYQLPMVPGATAVGTVHHRWNLGEPNLG